MILVALLAVACAARPPTDGTAVAAPRAAVEPGRLTVLHTNDMHGHFLPEPADWVEGRPPLGGAVRIEQEVRSIEAQRGEDAVLLLDGGDLLTGTPLTDLEVDGSIGGAMIQLMEAVGYDAWVVGNHEFDKGLDNLAALTAASDVPPLSANLRQSDGVRPLLPRQVPSLVFEVNGVRVGVIGATTMGLKGLMSRADWARLTLLDVEDAVAAEARRLDPDTDLLIALTHIGLDDDRRLASAVPSLDLIVGGHSHTRLPIAEEVAGVRIVQAGSYARSLGVVDLRVEDDRIASFEYTLRDLDPAVAPVPPSRRLVELTEGYQRQIDSYYGQKVSNAPALLGRDYHHESALGRWITDALRESAGADVAFYNGGGLRADLPAGPVTKGTLYACFPFKNEVRTFELTGEELTRIFLRNAIAENDEKRGFVSISGVRYVWRVRNGAPEVVTATVGGAPLDPARTYTAVTTSYIAEQWEKNLGVEPRNLQGTGRTDFDAAVEHAARGEVVAPTDARAVRER